MYNGIYEYEIEFKFDLILQITVRSLTKKSVKKRKEHFKVFLQKNLWLICSQS